MERHTKSYLQLIKPGITLSNTIAAIAGYFLAASSHGFGLTTFIGAIGGTALLIASGCVFNNIIDRKIDKRMKRTSKRVIVGGTISVTRAAILSAVLGGGGLALLLLWTNTLTVILGIIAYIWYVGIYGYAKRKTSYSTLIGGVTGALPPVAGYTAVTGVLDPAAVILFFILFFWQLPHFYAIAVFRQKEYEAAGLPIWSVERGTKSTKAQILYYALAYALVAPLLTVYGYTGIVYEIGAIALGAYWIWVGIRDYKKIDDIKWAKKMFGISLLVLLVICGLIAIGGYLP